MTVLHFLPLNFSLDLDNLSLIARGTPGIVDFMQLGRTAGTLFLIRCLRTTRGCEQYVELQEDPQDSDSDELQGVGAKRTRISCV